MIEKKINYIWLGGNKKNNLINICINSWRLVLKDYEIIEWNENNLNLDDLSKKNKFLCECRKRHLWAFMADYLRLYILYEYGGIYLDTDVQVLKSFDDLLNCTGFIGYEAYGKYFGTGIIAAEKHNATIKKILDFYEQDIWNVDIYTIPMILNYIYERDKSSFNALQIYSKDYFSPYDYRKEFMFDQIKDCTYSIHWFDGCWKKNFHVSVFLQTKHIKNPIKRNIIKLKKMIGYLFK